MQRKRAEAGGEMICVETEVGLGKDFCSRICWMIFAIITANEEAFSVRLVATTLALTAVFCILHLIWHIKWV